MVQKLKLIGITYNATYSTASILIVHTTVSRKKGNKAMYEKIKGKQIAIKCITVTDH